MRITIALLLASLLLPAGALALDVIEKDGGFRFVLPDTFSTRPNAKKSLSPKSQFDIQFSREPKCIFIPSGYTGASLDFAIDTTLKLAGNGFSAKVEPVKTTELTSKSGIPVRRVLASVQGTNFPYLVVIAFTTPKNVAVTYTVVPGEMEQPDAFALVDAMIGSLEFEK